MEEKSVLSDKAIRRHMEQGTVVITPFIERNLNTSSYDVTLGRFYYKEQAPEPGMAYYNPFSEDEVDRVWGKTPLEAETQEQWMKRTRASKMDNIALDDRIIWIAPGETLLAHTEEFLGGRGSVTTMMKARSSMGRNFVSVCKCAGWGDVGYVNRWTMEITNNSQHYNIPLVVGRRVAQIVFLDTEGTQGTSYETSGKYQTSSDVEELKKNWSPDQMRPKMWLDREIRD